ncbi:TPA: hypothetical protein I7745_19310 [Vibrio vulnificus]|nr:hypothetical protein [Vibrio vulnificus]
MIRNNFRVRHFLLLLFLFTNSYAFLYFILGGTATKSIKFEIDDLIVYQMSSFLSLTLILIILYMLFYKFSCRVRVSVSSLSIGTLSYKLHDIIGIIIIFSMSISLIVLKSSGMAAGHNDDVVSGGMFGVINAIFQFQTLVLVYICSCARSKVWITTVVIYVIYNLLLGWTSFILVLTLLYLFDKECRAQINWEKTFVFIGVVFLCYPLIYYLRYVFRVSVGADIGIADIQVLQVVGTQASWIDYVFFCYFQLVERLQQFYLNTGVLYYYDLITEATESGLIFPYYFEGLHRNVIGSIFYPNAQSLGSYLPTLFYHDMFIGDFFWNVSPGLIGWFISSNISIALLPLYVGLMVTTPVVILKRLGAPDLALSLVFIKIILLLFHGWMGQYFNFVWSLCVFYFLVLILHCFQRILR